MLRYPATTITLTMAEVKEFDRYLRFKKYLAMDDARTRAIAQAKSPNDSHTRMPIRSRLNREEGAVLKAGTKVVAAGSQDMTPASEEKTTPKFLSLRPRRPPRINDSGLSSSYPYRNTSQGTEIQNGNTHQPSLPTYTLALALPLRTPFSQGIRMVSDEHSLPSRPSTARLPTTLDDSGQVVAATSVIETALDDIVSDTRNSQLATNLGTGLVDLEVRAVQTSIWSPNRGAPAPTNARLASWMPTLEDGADHTVDTPMSTDQRFTIYNDSLPALSQPQTPQNLPEARHQSRLRGAYTVPIPRAEPRSLHQSSTVRGRETRARIPSGMESPGFRGLYGGIENSDDPDLLQEWSRLDEIDDENGRGN